jgi:hypothetical protein
LETLSTAASAQLRIRRAALTSLHLDPSNARLSGEPAATVLRDQLLKGRSA